MSRPRKHRRVENVPDITYFKPTGAPLRELDEVRLSVEEAEAIRLKDMECLEQEEGAKKMNISRPTFQRVLASARQKLADVLLNGKAIRIEGGNFEMTWRRFRCHRGHEWELDTPVGMPPELCPVCRLPDVEPVPSPGNGQGVRGKGRGHNRSTKDISQ